MKSVKEWAKKPERDEKATVTPAVKAQECVSAIFGSVNVKKKIADKLITQIDHIMERDVRLKQHKQLAEVFRGSKIPDQIITL